jgi:prolyl-tRNA editing enzyme YbaK/EbsC (Cys-tRNA(Pro) deacylase)
MSSPHDDLVSHIRSTTANAQELKHVECRTSEESARARAEGGAGYVTGAKAILMKLEVKGAKAIFALLVLPGFSKIDSKELKAKLKNLLPEVRSFRFARPEEMHEHARGMQPGCMPPFGRPLFPGISKVFVDSSICEHDKVGFNAARLDRSVVLPTSEYLKSVEHDGVFSFAVVE